MTASEQRLALALGVILIGGGAFLGLNKLKAWKLRVDGRAADVATRRAEADELLSHKDFWDQRASWLMEKQPPFTKAGESLSNVIAQVDELAGGDFQAQPLHGALQRWPGLLVVSSGDGCHPPPGLGAFAAARCLVSGLFFDQPVYQRLGNRPAPRERAFR